MSELEENDDLINILLELAQCKKVLLDKYLPDFWHCQIFVVLVFFLFVFFLFQDLLYFVTFVLGIMSSHRHWSILGASRSACDTGRKFLHHSHRCWGPQQGEENE